MPIHSNDTEWHLRTLSDTNTVTPAWTVVASLSTVNRPATTISSRTDVLSWECDPEAGHRFFFERLNFMSKPSPALSITPQTISHEIFGDIRVANHDDKPWFVAKDVAIALGYQDPDQAVRKNCTQAKSYPVSQTGQVRHAKVIPESDVYRLVMRSKLQKAEDFQDWVCDVVLPEIRRTGSYHRVQDQQSPSPALSFDVVDRPACELMKQIVLEFEGCEAAAKTEESAKVDFKDAQETRLRQENRLSKLLESQAETMATKRLAN